MVDKDFSLLTILDGIKSIQLSPFVEVCTVGDNSMIRDCLIPKWVLPEPNRSGLLYDEETPLLNQFDLAETTELLFKSDQN